METEQVPSYTGVITQNLFTEPTAPRRFSFLSHLPVAEKVGGAVVFVGALAFAFGGTCLGDWTETRMVRIGGGAAASAESVVPAQITQFTGGGDHPAFRETYRDAATGLALSGLSVGMGCAATSGVPSGAIVVLDLSGPLGSTTWNGQLDAQARVRVVGGINAPGSYTVTGGSWFLPATPAQRNRLSLGPAGTFSVPSPPAENPCDPSTLAPGVPLAASSASGAEAEPRTRTVTERHDAFPWSIPTGLGLAGLVAGGLWYDDRRRREDEREASGDAYDPARAAQLLDEAGWTADPETGARRPSGP